MGGFDEPFYDNEQEHPEIHHCIAIILVCRPLVSDDGQSLMVTFGTLANNQG